MNDTLARVSLLLPFLLAATGCGDDESTGGTGTPSGAASTTAGAGGGGTGGDGSGGSTGGAGTGGDGSGGGIGGAGSFALSSTAFAEGEMIPMVHLCESGGGDNSSPPLSWTPGPSGTQSYALVMRDLDFQNGFLHWVIWDIPASTHELPLAVEQVFEPTVPAGAKQAPFGGGITGYYGPCSPDTVNTYQFTIYAIDVATLPGLDDGSTKMEAEDAILGAEIVSATLSGES